MKIAQISALAIGLVSLASGGVRVVIRVENTGEKKPALDQRLWVEKDRLRMDLKADGGGEHLVIYRKDKDAVFLVDPAGKSYVEMTREEIRQAAERMRQAVEKMREAMKSMPPQQREMMEKMMSGNPAMGLGDSAADARMEYKKVGPAKAGSWSAVQYDGFRGGEKKVKVWVVDYGALGVTRADFEVMQEIGEFFRSLKITPPTDFYRDSEVLKGLPVRTVTLDDAGKDHMQIDLVEVKKEGVPSSRF